MSDIPVPSQLRPQNGGAVLIVPAASTASAGGAPGATIQLDGVEVVQAVQDLSGSVPLIAGKRTVVRVYLSVSGVAALVVRGTLAVQQAGTSGGVQIPATAPVVLQAAQAGAAWLRAKREDLTMSLNFPLPASLTTGGDLVVQLSQLESVAPVASLPLPASPPNLVTFRPQVPLRIHVVGIRYSNVSGGVATTYEPSAIDFALVRSWLERAYPVSRVDWSEIVVDWPGAPPWPSPGAAALDFWGRDEVNPFLQDLRTQDVAAGTDHRTHYFGLVADGGGFMRGWALTPATSADPTAVGCGPAGPPAGSFGWDTDQSYADWYAAHELAHTFGRQHPGFCHGNSSDDPAFPYPHGQIAHNNGDFVGYDAGDGAHGIPELALPGTIWHDVMTYCDNQWVSAYTYKALHDRLVAEDALPAPPAPGPSSSPPSAPAGGQAMSLDGIHVVARVNETARTGRFHSVTPIPSAASAGQMPLATGDYAIRLIRDDGNHTDYPTALRPDACGDNNEVTGSIDLVIPNDSRAASLELLWRETVLATFRPAGDPPDLKDVRSLQSQAGATPTLKMAATAVSRPKIAWTPVAPAGGAAPKAVPMAGAAATPADSRYTVQVSVDDGGSWRTIGVGLAQPEVSIDPRLLAGARDIRVRVTATNGFRSKSTTRNFVAADF